MAELFPVSDTALQAPAAPRASRVRRPVWRLTIQGKDVTREISPMVLSVTYSDHTEGESDSVDLQLEDIEGRWRGSWYPEKNAKVELMIGYEGEPLLPCGVFAVDELELSGPPDVFTIRALAAGKSPAYRTKRSAAYENQSLRQVAEAVAARHSLTVFGEIEEIRVERVTQSAEEDLVFLARVARDYGYVFNVRDDLLIFHQVAVLESAPSTFELLRKEVGNYRLTHRLKGLYKGVKVQYHDAVLKTTRTAEVEAEGVETGDVYKATVRVENPEQARARARALLRELNARAYEGQIATEGNPRLSAGLNGTLRDFGHFDGKYQVTQSIHRLARVLGYETTVHVRTAV